MGKQLFKDNLDKLGVNQNTLQALMNNLWPQYSSLETTITFDGGTTDAIGNDGGAQDPYTLLTVTGVVEIAVLAVCTTNLASAGGGTVELGTSVNTAGIIAQTTATDIDALDIWHDASPDASVEESTVITRKIVTEDVILTTGTADITGGVIKFIVFWNPISTDGNVTIA